MKLLGFHPILNEQILYFVDKFTLNKTSLAVWFAQWLMNAIKKSSQYTDISFLFVGAMMQSKETGPKWKTPLPN